MSLLELHSLPKGNSQTAVNAIEEMYELFEKLRANRKLPTLEEVVDSLSVLVDEFAHGTLYPTAAFAELRTKK